MAGLSVEEIVAKFPMLYAWYSDVSWLVQCLGTYPSGIDLFEAEWRTLICNMDKDLKRPGPDYADAFRKWRQLLRDWTRYLSGQEIRQRYTMINNGALVLLRALFLGYGVGTIWRKWGAGLSLLNLFRSIKWFISWTAAEFCVELTTRLLFKYNTDTNFDRPDELLRELDPLGEACFPFEQAFSRAFTGRMFCITQSGYMGWVPLSAQVGDELCNFRGCRMPYLIRTLGEGYRLHGACYLHGLMNGEAVRLTHVEETDIRLV